MMPLWFVWVCAVMGAVLAYWLVREVFRERRQHRRTVKQWEMQRQRWEKRDRDREIFEAIARGRR